jgi:hypothetical protein
MESFFNSLKNERLDGTRYRRLQEAVADLFEYTEVFYSAVFSFVAWLRITAPVPAGLAPGSADERHRGA